ncbi:SA1362 family protein [Bacillus sp. 1P06AnD]|uniref:SA1362 family protein n=1 Tax=Bacillus sp. 1P06AnD TaxID=3132208 RepID=UPI0039A1A54F
MKRPATYIVSGIILLAVFGLVTKFMANPTGMLTGILIFAIVAAIVFFAYKKFSASSTSAQSSYNRAVKQSKKHLQQKGKAAPQKTNVVNYSAAHHKKKARKKSEAHLTVIEGKKGKKNRA